jgi:deoxycytidylate deaminase
MRNTHPAAERAKAMPRYRCCFIDKDGEVIGVEIFDAAAAGDACARAEQLVTRVGYPAVEVRDHTEMIYRAEKQSKRRSRTRSKRPIHPHFTSEE